METFYIKLKQLGINLSDINIINRDRCSSGIFIYGEKDYERAGVKGLCCYYPQNTETLRVTIPENYRLEDIIMGLNYFISYYKCPVETNFALFHNKDLNSKIEINDIHKEIIGKTIYHECFYLSKAVDRNHFVVELYNVLQNQKHLKQEKIQELLQYKEFIFQIFKEAFEIAVNNNDMQTAESLIKIISDLKAELYKYPEDEYISYVENIIINVFRNLSSSMLLWETLKELKFGNSE